MDKTNKVCTETTNLVNEHLKIKNLSEKKPAWEIRKSNLGGRGMFASRDIEEGEIIFIDHPLLLGPRVSALVENACVICYSKKDLKVCNKNCGLYICSVECEESEMHAKECKKIQAWNRDERHIPDKIMKCLAPIRTLFLSKSETQLMKCMISHEKLQHGLEVDMLIKEFNFRVLSTEDEAMRFACAILDANAYEVIAGAPETSTLRGLFPLGSMVNHSCKPNITHVFNSKQYMISRAAIPIKKGQELFSSYTRLIWSTLTRRHHLFETKHFFCLCERCEDPTELGTYMSAVFCQKCHEYAYLLPLDSLNMRSQWKCRVCQDFMHANKIGFITSVLGNRLSSLDNDNEDIEDVLEFLHKKLLTMVPDCNQIAIELKYKVIWMLGHRDGYLLEEISDKLLTTKEKFCRDILAILQKLGVGSCKMRGLLLYELCTTIGEMHRRWLKNENNNHIIPVSKMEEVKFLMNEASRLFMYDIGAPEEIKGMWNKEEDFNLDLV